MGKRGPKPMPTAKLKLTGSWRAKYARKDEPLASGIPAKPEYLTGEASDMFNKLVLELDNMGVLGGIDENALIRYCETWSLYRQVLSQIHIVKVDDTNIEVNFVDTSKIKPLMALSEKLAKLEAAFGMTPSDRVGLKTKEKPKNNPLEDLIKRQDRNAG